MKRVAILTRRAGYNMGSTLQAYAMYKMFNKLGYDVEILNYDEYARFLSWRIKPFVFNIFNKIPFISHTKIVNKYFPLKHFFAQKQKFEEFESKYFPLSKKKYRNSSDLKKTIGKYDVYVCGSDQIWSPMMYDPVFYLDFVPKKPNILTIAYAPSLGVTDINAISVNAQRLIKNIQFISCREAEGAKILSKIVGYEIPVVLDPTLMINKDDWESIKAEQNLTHNNYILTYFLHTRFYQNNIPNKFINKLKKQTGLKVINIQMHNMEQIVNADEHIFNAGPADFLTLINNASFIVTNSYHCCIFSHIFSKHFFVFEKFRKDNDKDDQNPRLHTLLKIINKQEALIKNENCEIDLSQLFSTQNNSIDYYLTLKKQSMAYITQALQ